MHLSKAVVGYIIFHVSVCADGQGRLSITSQLPFSWRDKWWWLTATMQTCHAINSLVCNDLLQLEIIARTIEINPRLSVGLMKMYRATMNTAHTWTDCLNSITAQKTTIHQPNTMLSTSKNVLCPSHNHLLTTGADDLTLWLLPEPQGSSYVQVITTC